MICRNEVFSIGKIGRAHGLRGEVEMQFTDDVFDREDADFLVCDIDGLLVPFFLEEWRFKNYDTALVKFADINTADDARILLGADVFFPKDAVSHNEAELTSWRVLTGFAVSDTKAGLLGTVASVDESSANVLMDITATDGSDILLPIHPDLVAEFNIKERTLLLNLPEGLLSLN